MSDLLRYQAFTATNVAVRSGMVHHAVMHSGSSGGVAAGGAAAIALAVETPSAVKNGALVPITITGLNLESGQNAVIYANNCEVMEITNYGDTALKSLSTKIKMSSPSNGDAVVRVESLGRIVQSQPIKVSQSAPACNPNTGLNAAVDMDFNDYITDLKPNKKTKIKYVKKNGIDNISTTINHPMKSGLGDTAHYVTNISLIQDGREIVIIKTTPVLSKNPQLKLKIESNHEVKKYTLAWRDNVDRFGMNSVKAR
ncbi:MAG: thiosulfate oxidation carrier complex protein SoxZ [Gammaproteobacteria bacterium]|nr:thiosulfate oxidation carrier complex protein SoxZ [Gammaproteobacteria bacterium]